MRASGDQNAGRKSDLTDPKRYRNPFRRGRRIHLILGEEVFRNPIKEQLRA